MVRSILLLLVLLGIAPSQAQLYLAWSQLYNSPVGQMDDNKLVVLDSTGNLYVTGRTQNGPVTQEDQLSIKYDPNGNELWSGSYAGPASGPDNPVDMMLDADGNMLVTGWVTVGPGTNLAMGIMKYDPNGGLIWDALIDPSPTDQDAGRAIGIDASGDIYVAGVTHPPGGAPKEVLVVKYDSTGNQIWLNTYTVGEEAWDMVVGADNNVYVASNLGSDLVLFQLMPDGSQGWVNSYPTTGGNARLYHLENDPSGDLVATGYAYSGAGSTTSDMVTLKYDLAGNLVWDAVFDTGDQDVGYWLSIDTTGAVYVCGKSGDSLSVSSTDPMLVKYDAAGTEEWHRSLPGPFPGDERASQVVATPDGAFLAVVTSDTSLVFGAWWVGTTGEWVDRFALPGPNTLAAGEGVAWDGANCFVVVGYARTSGFSTADAVTRKYCFQGTPLATGDAGSGTSAQAFPLPFQRSVTITAGLRQGDRIDYAILDPSGRTVRSGSMISGGLLDLGALADGWYLFDWRSDAQLTGRIRLMKQP